jgi:hypothetical protein
MFVLTIAAHVINLHILRLSAIGRPCPTLLSREGSSFGNLSERLIQPSASTRKRLIIRSSIETNIASTVDKVIGLRRL